MSRPGQSVTNRMRFSQSQDQNAAATLGDNPLSEEHLAKQLNRVTSVASIREESFPVGKVMPFEVIDVVALIQLMMGFVSASLAGLGLLISADPTPQRPTGEIPRVHELYLDLYEGCLMIVAGCTNKFAEGLVESIFCKVRILTIALRVIALMLNVILLGWSIAELVYVIEDPLRRAELLAVICKFTLQTVGYGLLLWYTGRLIASDFRGQKDPLLQDKGNSTVNMMSMEHSLA